MRLSASVLLSLIAALSASASASCSYESGNYFCDEVSAVVYSNVGYSGTYKDVTSMEESSSTCSQEEVSFSGSNSPLDEELSVHFRGPLKLLQFGVYYPGSSTSAKRVKRDEVADEECTTTKHVHHVHKREAATEVVEITQTVVVDQYGNTVTAPATTAAAATTSDAVEDTTTAAAATVAASSAALDDDTSIINKEAVSTTSSSDDTTTLSQTSAETTSSTQSSTQSTSTASSSSDWNRVAYYSPGSTTNVTFLNTLGGSNSGVWSSALGNSLSYAASNGVDSASSAQALEEVTIASDDEYIIFSGSECSDDSVGDCGYYRSGIPAYHGFGGASKIFIFEFEMPHDTSSSGASNPDMPAIWLLNAKVPRTSQYGDASCSCWSTGCGELDLFEVLIENDDRLISHLHDGQGEDGTSTGGGGSQDYFTRPTSSSLKAAVIFEGSSQEIHVVTLDDSTDFGSGLDSDTVSSWLSTSGGTAALS